MVRLAIGGVLLRRMLKGVNAPLPASIHEGQTRYSSQHQAQDCMLGIDLDIPLHLHLCIRDTPLAKSHSRRWFRSKNGSFSRHICSWRRWGYEGQDVKLLLIGELGYAWRAAAGSSPTNLTRICAIFFLQSHRCRSHIMRFGI